MGHLEASHEVASEQTREAVESTEAREVEASNREARW
jgi:hypothetical protein